MITEKIRTKIFELAIPHTGSDYDNKITVSLGIASTSKNINSAKLIHLADEALYSAKADGRNRYSSQTA